MKSTKELKRAKISFAINIASQFPCGNFGKTQTAFCDQSGFEMMPVHHRPAESDLNVLKQFERYNVFLSVHFGKNNNPHLSHGVQTQNSTTIDLERRRRLEQLPHQCFRCPRNIEKEQQFIFFGRESITLPPPPMRAIAYGNVVQSRVFFLAVDSTA